MATSLSASRQKSCNACVRSKRRCDKRTPACSRCSKKRSLCVYGGQLDLSDLDISTAASALGLDSQGGPPPVACQDGILSSTDLFVPSIGDHLGNLGLSPVTATMQFDPTFDSLFRASPSGAFGDNMWQSKPSRLETELLSTGEVQVLLRKDYSKMENLCDDYHPWKLSNPNCKVAFTMSILKKLHVDFARDGYTICMHRTLYKSKMPRWILQAFSVCNLYVNMNSSNRGLVLRLLHDGVTELLTAANTTNLTPQEKLARVHALLLYETIRMFDGDITLGVQAQKDIELLGNWIAELCKIRDNLDSVFELGDDAIRANPPESWERWVFTESVRKTCILGYALQAFSDLVRLQIESDETGKWNSIHRWTLSRHLWEAPTSYDFFVAWKQKPHWIITSFNFNKFLETGVGDDIEPFSLMFLSIYFGVDEIKTFCDETNQLPRPADNLLPVTLS